MARINTIVLAVALAAAGAVAPPSLRGVKEAASGETADTFDASLAKEVERLNAALAEKDAVIADLSQHRSGRTLDFGSSSTGGDGPFVPTVCVIIVTKSTVAYEAGCTAGENFAELLGMFEEIGDWFDYVITEYNKPDGQLNQDVGAWDTNTSSTTRTPRASSTTGLGIAGGSWARGACLAPCCRPRS